MRMSKSTQVVSIVRQPASSLFSIDARASTSASTIARQPRNAEDAREERVAAALAQTMPILSTGACPSHFTKDRTESGSSRNTMLKRAAAFVIVAGSFLHAAVAETASGEQMISIVSPQFNSIQNDGNVEIGIRFGVGARQDKFSVHINGDDITKEFQWASRCNGGKQCDMEAFVPESDLLVGTNIVTATVNGPDETAFDARVKFQFKPAFATAGDINVSRMIPSVAVQGVSLTGSDSNDPNNYSILIGPGPGFAQKAYTPAGLSCNLSSGSMYVLALQRKTLAPDSTVGNGNGQFCESVGATLATRLQGISRGDLVIMHSFNGSVASLDTTAAGGTNYRKSDIKTYAYNAIGIVGAPAGTAFESYQQYPTSGRIASLVPLIGSLTLDIQQSYFFVPSGFGTIKVTPNNTADSGNTTVTYNGSTASVNASGDTRGGFFIVAIDRRSGWAWDQYVLPTNSSNRATAKQALADLGYLLAVYYQPKDLLIITTFGTPIGSAADVSEGLLNVFDSLGGTGYILPKLTSPNVTYTLLTSPDPDYVKGHNAIESTSLLGGVNTGELDGYISRDRKNLWTVEAADSDETLAQPLNFEWNRVAFQQPQDWPTWTNGQQKAYLDLTTSDHYPAVHYTLGCNACQPIRSYYDSGVASGDTPGVFSLDYSGLAYYPNQDYTAADFTAVIKQLQIEAGYERNVYSLDKSFLSITEDKANTIQLQLQAVADRIDASVANNNSQLIVKRLTHASGAAKILSVVPGIGSGFAGLSAVLEGASKLVPSSNGYPDDGKYGYTLKQLKDNNSTLSTDMKSTLTTMFTGITNDWGKLSIIGRGFGEQQAPWYMCSSCGNSKIPLQAMPAIAFAAKRQFYLQLLPTVFTLDTFRDQAVNNPAKLGGMFGSGINRTCKSAYANAQLPAYWSYPNIGTPASNDIYSLVKMDYQYDWQHSADKLAVFANTQLTSDLLDQPQVNNLRLEGGAGFSNYQLMPSNGYMSTRAGYRPGAACTTVR
jgi:hypothetical protein